jgi:hypothetical protein
VQRRVDEDVHIDDDADRFAGHRRSGLVQETVDEGFGFGDRVRVGVTERLLHVGNVVGTEPECFAAFGSVPRELVDVGVEILPIRPESGRRTDAI